MAIVFLQQKKFQKNLILIFLAALLIMAVVVWQGFFKKETGQPLPEILSSGQEEVKIDFEILKSPFLKGLQPFPEIEPFQEATPTEGKLPEKVGRENPFIPY